MTSGIFTPQSCACRLLLGCFASVFLAFAAIGENAVIPIWSQIPSPAGRSGEQDIQREAVQWYCQHIWPRSDSEVRTLTDLREGLLRRKGEFLQYLRMRAMVESADIPFQLPISETIVQWCSRRFPEVTTISEEKIEDFYRQNQSDFLVPEHRSVFLILIPATPEGKEKVAALQARLRQGESFDKLRQEFDTGDEQQYAEALRSKQLQEALRQLSPEQPDAHTEAIATPKYWAIGRTRVYPAHYLELNEELRAEIRLRLQVFGATRRLHEEIKRANLFNADNELELFF